MASARLLQCSAATGRAVGAPVKPVDALRRKPDEGDDCHLLRERWSLRARPTDARVPPVLAEVSTF